MVYFPELRNSPGFPALPYILKSPQTELTTTPERRAHSAQERGPGQKRGAAGPVCRPGCRCGGLWTHMTVTDGPFVNRECSMQRGSGASREFVPVSPEPSGGYKANSVSPSPLLPIPTCLALSPLPRLIFFSPIWRQPPTTPQKLFFLSKLAALTINPAAYTDYSI